MAIPQWVPGTRLYPLVPPLPVLLGSVTTGPPPFRGRASVSDAAVCNLPGLAVWGYTSVPKFFQYRLGVGPRCPWYLEPSPPDPYGFSAASESCTNESCPIFISG